jgi:hypothetical protein
MIPERLEFLNRFNSLYLVIVNAVKEDKLNERDFYALIRAKAKTMNQERREKLSETSDRLKKEKAESRNLAQS